MFERTVNPKYADKVLPSLRSEKAVYTYVDAGDLVDDCIGAYITVGGETHIITKAFAVCSTKAIRVLSTRFNVASSDATFAQVEVEPVNFFATLKVMGGTF